MFVYELKGYEFKVYTSMYLFFCFCMPENSTLHQFWNCKRLKLRENCPNTELFLVRIFLYSEWIQESTDQK